jgi:hypothetical protein
MENLNENEKTVLTSLYNEVMSCTSGEFGYMEDASRCSFSKHEFAGYISSLKSKKVFEYLDGTFNGQFALTESVMESFKVSA